jgi:hypothetical protein
VPPLPDSLPHGRTVWVAVSLRDGFHEVVRSSLERFEPGAGEVLLKAEANGWSGGRNASREVQVEYGLERYYVREGTGNPRGKITVEAVVPAAGSASIKQVLLDGKPYAEAMKAAEH